MYSMSLSCDNIKSPFLVICVPACVKMELLLHVILGCTVCANGGEGIAFFFSLMVCVNV